MAQKRHAAGRAARTAVTSRFVVLTGVSGSGKSQAIRALEDLGYFCVDNLPVTLLPTLADLTLRAGSEIARAAVVVDVREGRLLTDFPAIYRRLKTTRGLNPVLIFLEASESALVRRFSETRRPHPLAPDRSAIEGIREERKAMRTIRGMADHVVDTSGMTVHELRHAFTNVASGRAPGTQLVVTILSFGFKHGIPVDSDLLFDVRFLPNPHFVAKLRPHTGRDRDVVRYLERSTATARFPAPHAQPAELPGPAVRDRGQDVSDRRHRLHRRAASLGRDGRGAQKRAGRHQRRAPARHPPGHRPGDMSDGSRFHFDPPSHPAVAGIGMKLGVVVVTHGQLAAELMNSAEMIVGGDLPHMAAVSMGWHDDVDQAKEDIGKAIERVRSSAGGTETEPANVLVLTDLFGGTPANLAVTFVDANVEVITGVNLPMLIKLARPPQDMDLLTLAREMREHGRNAIWVTSDLLRGDKG